MNNTTAGWTAYGVKCEEVVELKKEIDRLGVAYNRLHNMLGDADNEIIKLTDTNRTLRATIAELSEEASDNRSIAGSNAQYARDVIKLNEKHQAQIDSLKRACDYWQEQAIRGSKLNAKLETAIHKVKELCRGTQ